ncbi:MAG: nitrate/nitrite transporter NrtS [Alphaproteobacteria bacterium]|nr:nitrate/nitrite transporter NrtS [Alphaproteobacteria bacterium]
MADDPTPPRSADPRRPRPVLRARLAWRYAISDGVPARSLRVALVVGTALNVINQGDVLIAGRSIDWLKLALTFAMPYVVSTYGAVAVRFSLARAADRARPQR